MNSNPPRISDSLTASTKRLAFFIADALAVPLCLWLAIILRFGEWNIDVSGFYWLFPLVALVTVGLLSAFGVYQTVTRYMGAETVLAGVAVSLLVVLALLLMVFVYQPPNLPRSSPPIFGLLFGGWLMGSRMLVREFSRNAPSGAPTREVLVYGSPEQAAPLIDSLHVHGGTRVIGLFDHRPEHHRRRIARLPVRPPSALKAVVANTGVQTVLLTYPAAASEDRRFALEQLSQLPLSVRFVPDLSEFATGEVSIDSFKAVELADLLGRPPVPPRAELISGKTADRVVMVTGAGGSIGSELSRQILGQTPKHLVLFDVNEFALFQLKSELHALQKEQQAEDEDRVAIQVSAVLGDVRQTERLTHQMRAFGVETVFHAAAYKHVAMVEENLIEGLANNTFGSESVVRAAVAAQAKDLVLISTDKAVRPTCLMGASKRVAEMIIQAHAGTAKPDGSLEHQTRCSLVRFGNVLGSSGSVVPLFTEQLRQGGPLSVRHPDATRYFMSMPEAAQLVLQASALAQGGDVFLLDMGEPVCIDDMARRMVHLSGLEVRDEKHPHGTIKIEYTGLLPGEKLHEELLIGQDPLGTEHPKIMRAREPAPTLEELAPHLKQLRTACGDYDCELALAVLRDLLPDADLHHEILDLAQRAQQPVRTLAKVHPLPGS